MSTFEYMEVELHGDSGVRDELDGSPVGQGTGGFVAKLNVYGALGWEMVWMDRDTTVHVIAMLKREIP